MQRGLVPYSDMVFSEPQRGAEKDDILFGGLWEKAEIITLRLLSLAYHQDPQVNAPMNIQLCQKLDFTPLQFSMSLSNSLLNHKSRETSLVGPGSSEEVLQAQSIITSSSIEPRLSRFHIILQDEQRREQFLQLISRMID
jgi:hypothetical protein